MPFFRADLWRSFAAGFAISAGLLLASYSADDRAALLADLGIAPAAHAAASVDPAR